MFPVCHEGTLCIRNVNVGEGYNKIKDPNSANESRASILPIYILISIMKTGHSMSASNFIVKRGFL